MLYRALSSRASLDQAARAPHAPLLLVALALFAFLPGFFALAPLDRDEPRFAQASKQMVESGDLIDIRFQDQPRHKKPAGIYWLQAGSAALAGEGASREIWVYRLPSLAGAMLAVALTFVIGRTLVGASVGFAAAAMVASCLLLGVEARLAKTDAALLAAILAAQAALARIYMDWRQRRETPPWVAWAHWGAIGIGALLKGPIILLVVWPTAALLSAIERDWRWLARLKPARGLALALAMTLPWLIAIAIVSEGAFFREAVGRDLLGKVYEGQENHGAPPGYYALLYWLTFWPFAGLLALAAPWLWRHRSEPAIRFVAAWILPTWLVFELIVTKLPHYVLPTYPAVAIAIAAAFAAGAPWREGRWAYLGHVGLGLATIAGLALALALAYAPYAIDGAIAPLALVAALAAAAAPVLWWRAALAAKRDLRVVAQLCLCAIVTYMAAFGAVMPRLEGLRLSPAIAAAYDAHLDECAQARLVTVGYSEPSLVFLAGAEIRFADAAGAAAALESEPCALALVWSRDDADFRAALASLEPEIVAEVEGFNLGRGRVQRFALYRAPSAVD